MQSKLKFFITLLFSILTIALISLLLSGIQVVADIFAYIDPRYATIAFWSLSLMTFSVLAYCIISIFVIPKPLFLPDNATEDEVEAYRQAYFSRLKKNTFLNKNDLPCRSEEDIPVAIATLENEANRLIEETSKRVFIGTATAQNGRLDMLIVFCLITHLVYKITKLYAQRPHFNELVTLYKNVAATAFFAGALEDIVIEEYTQQIVAPLVASSAVGSVPGAQGIATIVTTSILDGSTNSLLCMRCGIIARNYMGLNTARTDRKSLRKSATKEAAAMFMRTSGETISKVTRALLSGASSTIKKSMKKAWDAVRNGNGSATCTASVEEQVEEAVESEEPKKRFFMNRKRAKVVENDAARSASEEAASTSSDEDTADEPQSESAAETTTTKERLRDGLSSAKEKFSQSTTRVASTVSSGGKQLKDKSKQAAKSTVNGISQAASNTSKGISSAASTSATVASNTASKLQETANNAASSINAVADSATATLSSKAKTASKTLTATADTVNSAASSAANSVNDAMNSTARKTKKLFSKPFSRSKKKPTEHDNSQSH